MSGKIIFRVMIFLFLVFSSASRAFAYTAADYVNAGQQLYTAQNYRQAIQYFGAALGLDPQNTSALQGRANCYYALGQYPQALADYRKVEAISPSDQLAQFIQALQAKIGPAPPAAGPPLPAATDSLSQGTALYQQQQYAAALPFFQKATQDNPNNYQAYYYLGATQLNLGDKKDAALALAISNRLQPNPSVAAYSNQLQAGLSPDDQVWVETNLNVFNPHPTTGTVPATTTVSGQLKSFGFRVELAMALAGLGDFETNAKALTSNIGQLQTSVPDPSLVYTGRVPQFAPDLGIEGVLPLSDHFEAEMPLSFFPVGTVSDAVNDSSGDTYNDAYGINAFSLGVNLRYLLTTDSFQPFVSVGALLVPMVVSYSGSYNFPGNSNGTASGNFGGVGFGGQVELGVDWHIDDTFVFSPFVGYQLAGVNSLTSTINSSGQTVQLETIPTAGGREIALVSGGKLQMPVFTNSQVLLPGTAVPAGAQPLRVDLSGLKAGIQLSAFF